MSYTQVERARASAWKRLSPSLPAEARPAAPYIGKNGEPGTAAYDFCLPASHAELSLLPGVREGALALFAELGIPWHAGVDGGPSNHLLSSQVQCANALFRMVDNPTTVMNVFGELLGTAEVLQIEPSRFLTFEYIDTEDFFGEAIGGKLVRGSKCTSLDAAFLHRTHDGIVELVLLEWKYTESYGKREASPKDVMRERRYGAALRDPAGPVRADLLPFEALLDEPFYQLMRQQLLAAALEKRSAHGAERVRVVHVTPAANLEYQGSLSRPEHRALGSTVSEVWHKLLRQPDRFLSVDSSHFLHADLPAREYLARYGDVLVRSELELLAITRSDDVAGIEYQLFEYVDGVVRSHEGGLTVVAAADTAEFNYPFWLSELFLTALDLEAVANGESAPG